MRKPFAVAISLLLALGNLLPTTQPTLTNAAPPPPVSPTPAWRTEPTASPQTHTPPPPDKLPLQVEQARARQAMEAVIEKHLRYWGPRYQVAPVEVRVEGDWAHGVAEWKGPARTFKEPAINVLAHRLPNGSWQALMPETDGLYLQWLDAVPERLVPAGVKSRLRLQAAESDALRPRQAVPAVPPALPSLPGPAQLASPGGPIPTATPTALGRPALHDKPSSPSVPPSTPTSVSQPQTWIAGETSVSRLSQQERLRLLGVPKQVVEWEREQANREIANPGKLYTYPSAKDWRNWNGQDWTTPIRNQAGCGSCVSFATVGAIESRLEIANNNPDLDPDLSEAHLFYCNGGDCDNGWWPSAALDAARDTGIVTEACYPYSDNQQSCNPCSNWQSQVTKISSWSGTSNTANMKQALADSGPLETTMAVYTDFFAYSGGIYRHTQGGLAGYHAVSLVGYNDTGGYWIAKNSWGTDWGEDKYGNPNGGGWFRIAYGESGIDNYAYIPVVSIADTTPPDGDYTSPPNNATVGQTAHLAAWATDSDSGVKEVHFTAKWNNAWHLVYNDTSAPYEYDWDLCTWGVPDGDIELGLDIYDNAGNIFHLHLKHANPHITKSYNCTTCNPSADQVALYVDVNYGGQCVVKGIGQYPNPSAIGLPNDSVSSLRVGGNVRAILCRDDDYDGGCETFNGDDSNLSDNSIGSDQVSAARVEPRTQPPSPPNLSSPDDQSIFNEGSSIVLSWSATGDEYYGEISGGPGGTLTFGWQTETSKNIGPQWAGYTYSWHVKARNGAGESDWSSTWTFTVKPAPPSNLSAQTTSCSQVNLYWTDNSGNEEGYKVYRNGSYVGQMGMNSTSYHDSGLSGNTSYSYYVKAYRGSIESDASNTFNIATPPCVSLQPDLMPSQWGGWPYPVVPSSITDTSVVNLLFAGRPTFIDWGLTNAGNASTGGSTYGDLYIDSTRVGHYDFGDVQPGWTWAFFDWMEIISTPGWHTLTSVVDPDNLIAESDETNNLWEREFYWVPTAPYSDTMENGTNNWTSSGLWHQVGPSSPYPASHSGAHSWWYGRDSTGNYDTGTANSGDLTSRSIYIPSTGYYLRFWYQYETETQASNWDQRWVQISVDSGPFNDVLQLYDDPKNWWLQSPAIDLSGYAGHTIQVRFYFDTIDSVLNAFRGWYIDDVSITSSPPPDCADSHEPNNVVSQATAIAYGQTLNGYICPGGDYDWYAFTGAAGDKVIVDIDAKANGSLLDPYIFLVDSDGTSVLAENDDEILYEVQDSKLGYQLTHDGIHYVKVRAWDHPTAGGTDYFYTIHVFTDAVAPVAAITSPASDSYLNPTTVTITVSANDSGSGINHVTFWWHDADWQNSNWVWLGADYDGRNGWSWNFDTSGLPEQRGGAFYIWASDWIENGASAGAWNVGIDRTPPQASVGTGALYGDAPFSDFYAWWSGWDNLSGIANYDVQYRDGTTGSWINWLAGTTSSYYRFVGQNGHTYYFRARAHDQAGNLGNYTDGSTSYTVQICPASPDVYEVDNLRASAKWIDTNGITQTHTIHAEGDQDWVRFSAVRGADYALTTANIGGHADTMLYLYGTDGSTLVAYNDDYPLMGYASRIDWRPAVSGVYYAMVKHWDEYAYGCTTSYGLSVQSNVMVRRVHLPLVLRDFTSSTPPPPVRTLNFRVQFQGRDNAAGKLQNIPIKVRIKNLTLPTVLFESEWIPVIPAGGSNNWGTASVDVSSAGLVPGQSYRVFVQGAMHLVKRVTLPLVGGVTIDYTNPALNPGGVLGSCDINEDNIVNLADLNTLLTYGGATPSGALNPSSPVYRSDLNGDGTIDESDQSICLVNWGKGGDSD